MKVLCVDDEKIALESILFSLEKIPEVTESVGFNSPLKCLDYLKEETADVAFLDINMRKMDGLTLAKAVKELRPEIYIIFLTGYSEYAVDAFKLRASGYLLKPASVEDVRDELSHISVNDPVSQNEKRVQILTFGNFEALVDGKPIAFSRSRSKEILAYLIDRKGARASLSEIASILWEDGLYDRSRQKQMQNFITDLLKALKAVHAEAIIQKDRTGMCIDKSMISCDYYDFLDGDIKAVNSYTGEYMTNYSWGEFTIGILDSKVYGDDYE